MVTIHLTIYVTRGDARAHATVLKYEMEIYMVNKKWPYQYRADIEPFMNTIPNNPSVGVRARTVRVARAVGIVNLHTGQNLG